MHFGMWKRHQRLAEREKCGETWDPKPYAADVEHVHSCKVFKGHTGHHACACGSGTSRGVDKSAKVGARA